MNEEIKGLTTEEVKTRIKSNKTNIVTVDTEDSIKDIIYKNIFTYFNLIFLILSILLVFAGSLRNLSFLPIIIINILIGIVQQIKSKLTLDKLSLLDKTKYMVIRDGKEVIVNSDELVLDDYVVIASGNQIPADAIIVSGNISVNESLLTGEADEIEKAKDEKLMSGSFCVSGKAIIKLTAVGDDSYSAKIMKDSKKIKETKSEMISSIDNIVKIAGISIIPIGILLFIESFIINGNSYKTSVVSMVSAVIGMIPEGLYLLTTVALALSAMRLARKKVLLHDMKSIESLARVDVLCVDKTGTITNNKMSVTNIYDKNKKIIDIEDKNVQILNNYINTIEDNNITMQALKDYLKEITKEKLNYLEKEDFNSKNKYSYIKINDKLTYKLGAPEILLKDDFASYENFINTLASTGERVLSLVEIKNSKTYPILFVSLKNEIRKNAKEIFSYFNEQGVEIRVISGDNPKTASSIAKMVNIKNAEKYVDCRDLDTYQKIKKAVQDNIVFGRVSPKQKRQIIRALKEENLKVAMTGDGVNDILAMKEADCSISVGTGSDAARDVAQVVLLDSDFGKMQNIVYEGRKNINNITRSATLFIYKNIFSFLLAVYSIIFATTYPLEPTQVSLGAAFTIGIPAFLLTFEENQKKQTGSFIKQVLSTSIPAAITPFVAIVCMVNFSNLFGVSSKDISTACSYLFFVGGFLILYKIIKPMNVYRFIVMILCIAGMIATIHIIPDFFAISSISTKSIVLVVLFAIAEFSVMRWIYLFIDKVNELRNKLKKSN